MCRLRVGLKIETFSPEANRSYMETVKHGFFAEVKDIAEQYVNDRILLIKLEASERIATVVSKTYIFIPILLLSILILAIITFLGGYYLSVWLGAYWAGFGIMLLLYVGLIFLLLYLHKTSMKKAVANKVVKSIFE